MTLGDKKSMSNADVPDSVDACDYYGGAESSQGQDRATLSHLRAELEQVKRERDAAVSENFRIATTLSGYVQDYEERVDRFPVDPIGQAAPTIPEWKAKEASSHPSPEGELRSVAAEINAERTRQISAEGWTPEHDDQHGNGELAHAAACYAAGFLPSDIKDGTNLVPWIWPWDRKWWKPTNPRRCLIKAGALIIAEIERLDRAALSSQEGGK
jgi:hypothetical protein